MMISTAKSTSILSGIYQHTLAVIAGYENMLKVNPIFTKSVTSGIMYGAGDIIAQSISADDADSIDSARWLRAVTYGGLFYPWPAHIHYNFLEELVVVRWKTAREKVPFVKMFIEQFVYWS